MDTQSERLFIEALGKAVAKSQTLVIATHREAILQMCDRIIVIDGGRIAPDAPRAEILARTSQASAIREAATYSQRSPSGRALPGAPTRLGRAARRGETGRAQGREREWEDGLKPGGAGSL